MFMVVSSILHLFLDKCRIFLYIIKNKDLVRPVWCKRERQGWKTVPNHILLRNISETLNSLNVSNSLIKNV